MKRLGNFIKEKIRLPSQPRPLDISNPTNVRLITQPAVALHEPVEQEEGIFSPESFEEQMQIEPEEHPTILEEIPIQNDRLQGTVPLVSNIADVLAEELIAKPHTIADDYKLFITIGPKLSEATKEEKDIYKQSGQNLVKFITDHPDQNILLNFKNKEGKKTYRTLNMTQLRNMNKLFLDTSDPVKARQVYDSAYNNLYGHMVMDMVLNKDYEDIAVEVYDSHKKGSGHIKEVGVEIYDSRKRGSGYFPKLTDSYYNMEVYQILHKDINTKLFYSFTELNCFISSLINYVRYSDSFNEEDRDYMMKVTNDLKKFMTHNFRTRDLNKILPEGFPYKISIINYTDSLNVKSRTKYGRRKSKKEIKIVNFMKHYMPNIPCKGRPLAGMLNFLVSQEHLVPNHFNIHLSVESEDISLLNYDIKLDQKLYEFKQKKTSKLQRLVVYSDLESAIDDNGYHTAFMCGARSAGCGYPGKVFIEHNIERMKWCSVFTEMLSDVIRVGKVDGKKHCMQIYFHNLKYDYSLICNNPHISIRSELNRNGALYSVDLVYKGINIKLCDSYKMLSMPLSDFKDTFKLDKGKGLFNFYKLICPGIIKRGYIEIDTFKILLKEREGVDYKSLSKELRNEINNYTFNGVYMIMEHYKDYLLDDVDTLRSGMNIFKVKIQEICDVNIFDFVSISSIATYYYGQQGCFDGCYKVGGNLQNFLYKCVKGGRVATKDGKKVHITKDNIQDFDGISLYPSAMVRSKFPKGMCEIISREKYIIEDTKKFLDEMNDKYQMYFVNIRASVRKNQQIAFMSVLNDDGTREWSNIVNKNQYLDRTELEDAINFHKLEAHEYIMGVGYPHSNGYNEKHVEVTNRLFKQRAIAKRAGNAGLSTTLKLLLNSSYGGTLLKDSSTEILYLRSKEELVKYITNNPDSFIKARCISEYTVKGGKDIIEKYRVKFNKRLVGNYNFAQIGANILSMSKRIMNEVMDTANDLGIPMIYQDTDSMHMLESDVSRLEQEYEKRYHRKLVGSGLGQFHCDFMASKNMEDELTKRFKDKFKEEDIDDLNEDDKAILKSITDKGVRSTCNITLGKKTYYDKISYISLELGLIEDDHIRFKGIGAKTLINLAKEEHKTVEDIFMECANEKRDLLVNICNGGVKFKIDVNSTRTLGSSFKTCKFIPILEKVKQSSIKRIVPSIKEYTRSDIRSLSDVR